MESLNILVYPHLCFCLHDGGTTVQYYLCKILRDIGINVKMHPVHGNSQNDIFSDYYNDDFAIDDCIVIYCEGIVGNPLNAKKVVRWMLSPLGTNVPLNRARKWSRKELVYYFNAESRFKGKDTNVFKLLTICYLDPNVQNHNILKEGYCHTYRKTHFYKNPMSLLHPPDSYNITYALLPNEYTSVFNKYKYFVCYDPLCFLCTIAVYCGCIAIVHPHDNKTKEEWYENTWYSEYVKQTGKRIYGISYGNSPEELEFANRTVHLAKGQWDNEISVFYKSTVLSFVHDLMDFGKNINTLTNNLRM